MNKQSISLRFSILAGMILLAAMSRLLPHPHNFTPIGALALFGSAYFSRKWLAIGIPFAALWLSDLVLNNLVYAPMFPEFYQDGFVWFSSAWVYVGFLLIALFGMASLQNIQVPTILGASVGASVIFFLVTNFASWMGSSLYPQNVSGLIAAYIAGIPFFWNTLAGDLFYVALLFGSYALLQRKVLALAR